MKQYERAKMILEEGREEGREEAMHFYIESMQELHVPRAEVESKLASKYGSADAKKYLNLYWK